MLYLYSKSISLKTFILTSWLIIKVEVYYTLLINFQLQIHRRTQPSPNMGPPQVNRINLHNETLPTFSFVYSTMAAANLLGSSPDTVTTPGCFPRYCRIPMICSFLLQPK